MAAGDRCFADGYCPSVRTFRLEIGVAQKSSDCTPLGTAIDRPVRLAAHDLRQHVQSFLVLRDRSSGLSGCKQPNLSHGRQLGWSFSLRN
jgi:hypothetical protein